MATALTTSQRLARTAKRLETAAGTVTSIRAERDALIVQLRREGFSLEAIGELARMTHPMVIKVLRREGEQEGM